ncbi:MAG TPA: NAD-dependent dihydropyrimidine dehydrogenase subunit PreA [Tepidisphaeraceae bacterium]|jgi:dihydropyrimidine dehydrogenase (NAD+) subunit PreA|nr:NAD-dependent dihydropyrimidine dehydrogenase subunit PreA [Tepidisphaeraceae bacterium]
MPDLSCNIGGIKSPNPFWLASGPPTNTAYQVRNAFDAGWGGAVWKTLTDDPIVNVASRYGGISLNNQKLMGLNNIELITDRSLDDNLREIAEVKRKYPNNAVIASVMVESKRESWHRIIKQIQDVGVDGFELNFGCPHGMSERGMGSAVGQVPEYAEMICGWVKEVSSVPVLAKLTPNVADIKAIARAVKRGGGDGISLINTINSIIGIDLSNFSPKPSVGGLGSHGGYCGPAVKPIALFMVSEVARDPDIHLPISGIGGIRKWEDAVEFMLLGATGLQVCTAVMHRGFGVIKSMTRGLEQWMKQKGFESVSQIVGQATPRIRHWGDLDLNYKVIAQINESTCIHCGICYASCEDGCYQAIDWQKMSRDQYTAKFGEPRKLKGEAAPNLRLDESGGTIDVFTINTTSCVGCNMCALACPVEGCITMEEVPTGKPAMNWNQYQEKLKSHQMEPIQPKKAVKSITVSAGE